MSGRSSPDRVAKRSPLDVQPQSDFGSVEMVGLHLENFRGEKTTPGGAPSPPHEPALVVELPPAVDAPSAPGDEIAIDGRPYVSADRAASILDISRKTLSRRVVAGKAPPTKKIGNKTFFELDAILGSLAATNPKYAANDNNN
jgi:hypothetical protein